MISDQNVLALIMCVFKATITNYISVSPFTTQFQMPLTQILDP